MRCLARDPDDRPESARAVASALDRVLREAPRYAGQSLGARQVAVAVVDKIDHPVQGQFDVVPGVLFDFGDHPGIHVPELQVKILGHTDAALPEKDRPPVVFPDILAQ